jgi:hypothetical protein
MPLMHGDARLYAAQLLAALSFVRGAWHGVVCGWHSELRQPCHLARVRGPDRGVDGPNF